MIESFLAVFQWGDLHDQKSTITMLGAICVHVNISAASVYDVKRQIKSKKLQEKNSKFTV